MLRVFFKSHFFKSNAHVMRHLEYLNKQGPLFNGGREVNLTDAQGMVQDHPGAIKWWFVYSLTREDQQRLQIDRGYFQDLMEAQRLVWAKAYNIPPDRLHICASFHDVAHHPHIHVVLHGETASDGFIVQRKGQTLGEAFCRCRETVKSAITNEIYREDTQHLKVEKNEQRKNMNQELEKILLEIGRSSHPVSDKMQIALSALAAELAKIPGKHQYGYLPSETKLRVDDLLREIVAQDRQINRLFTIYEQTQAELVQYEYVGKKETLAKKMAEWEKAFYHPPKGGDTRRHNLIIQAAEAMGDMQHERKMGAGETSEHNKKKQRAEERDAYRAKSATAATRNMLYLIASTTRDDTLRSWGLLPKQIGHAKFKRKHIHKRTIEERGKEQDIGR